MKLAARSASLQLELMAGTGKTAIVARRMLLSPVSESDLYLTGPLLGVFCNKPGDGWLKGSDVAKLGKHLVIGAACLS